MKIEKVHFKIHPLMSNTNFDFRDKSGLIPRAAIIVGENGTGKTMMLESLACLHTRFKDFQSSQIAIFDFEITDQEFNTLVDGTIKYEDLRFYEKNKITVNVTSQFVNGKYINNYEIQLKHKDGFKELRPDLSNNFERIKKIIFLGFNHKGLQYNKDLFININSPSPDFRSEKLRDILGTLFLHLKEYSSNQIANTVDELSDKGRPFIDEQDLSSGEKQAKLLGDFFINNFSALNNTILLIDEPETALHPKWQKRIFEFINHILDDSDTYGINNLQIIFTTHSPYLLQNFFNKNAPVFIFKRNINEEVTILNSSNVTNWPVEKVIKETFNTDFFITDYSVLFAEGETDEIYLNKCLEVYEMYDFPYQIRWIGKQGKNGNNFFSGESALDHAKGFLLANEELMLFPIILLYDNDTNKPKEKFNKLRVDVLPQNQSSPVYKIGIENLLLLPANFNYNDFYTTKVEKDNYGGSKTITKLDKMKLCNHLCNLSNFELKTIFRNIFGYLSTIK